LRALRPILPYLVSFLLWAAAVKAANLAYGDALAPGPIPILKSLFSLMLGGGLFLELGLTVKRALYGAILANILGVALGLAAGRVRFLLSYTAPLVAGLQSCPPIIWISLVMVLAGTGSLVPVMTVLAATFPLVFSNTAQGAMGLPERAVLMGRLYGVPALRVFRDFTLPGILPFYLAGLSTVLSTAWKAAAVAEFMGSHDGAGARIYWCYTRLDMEGLHAWALAIIILGLGLEGLVITPLRRKAALMASRGA
jgi:ABC-type nitrate/sulfonate/bicarbonate transport system permease component